jgi:hypothetical protein
MSGSIDANVDVIRRATTASIAEGPDGPETPGTLTSCSRLRDGLIVRAQFFLDESSALEAAGAGRDAALKPDR